MKKQHREAERGKFISEETARANPQTTVSERRRKPLKRKIEKDEHGDYFWTLGEQAISIERFDTYEKAEKDLQRFLKRL